LTNTYNTLTQKSRPNVLWLTLAAKQ